MSRVLLIKADQGTWAEVSPPLGLCCLASYLRDRRGDEVRILDLRVPGSDGRALKGLLADFNPDVVGFSSFSYEAEAMHGLAADVRRALPKSPIVVGGPYASAEPERMMSDPNVDYGVVGEGEAAFAALLNALEAGGDPSRVGGVIFRRDGASVINPPAGYIEDLDSLPFPAWDAIDMPAYFRLPRQGFIYKHPEYFQVFTSRGCPFHCIYCHNVFGKRFRARSPENVLAEIDRLVRDHGVREIHIIDDIFNLNRERAEAVLQGIVDRDYGLALSFPNGVRGDLLDPEFIALMKRAGTYKVSVAVESGTERVQKLIRKNVKLDRVRESINRLADARILTHVFFMTGFPTETEAEVLETVRFAGSLRSHSASFFIVNPFRGTELYEMIRERSGDLPASSNYFDPALADLRISEVPPERLKSIVRAATRGFHFRPSRILRILRDVPSRRLLFLLGFLVVMRSFFPGSLGIERRLFHQRVRSRAESKAQTAPDGS